VIKQWPTKRATRLTTVGDIKEQNLVITLEIKDEFVVRFIALLKYRLSNLIKEDIQKTVSLSIFFLLVMVETDHTLEGGKGYFRDSRMA